MSEPNELLNEARFALTCMDDGLPELGLRKLRAAVEKADAAKREDDRQLELLASASFGYPS